MRMKMFNTYTTDKYNRMLFASMMSYVLSVLMESVDYILAGIYIGAEGTKIVNIILPITHVAVFFSYMIVVGPAIIYGERIGKFDKKGADNIFTMTFISAIAMGLIYAGIVFAAGKAYMGMYSIAPDMYESAMMYYRAGCITMIFKPMSTMLYSFPFLDGDSTTPTWGVIASLISKIVFSILLIGHYGLLGLGIASIICIVVNVAVEALHFLKKNNSLKLSSSPDFKGFIHAMKYSMIDATVYIYSAILVVILNLMTQNSFGPAALLLASAVSFVKEWFRITDGIGVTMEPFVNMYHGQGTYDGVRKIFRHSIIWSLILGAVFCILFSCGASALTAYLGVTDPEMAGICTAGICILAVGFLINSVIYCMTSYYLYIGRIGLGLVITAFNDFIMLLASLLVCLKLFGTIGIFIAFPVGALLTLAGFLLVIRIKYGKEKFPTMVVHGEDTADDSCVTDDVIYDYEIEDNSIMELKDNVEKYLEGLGYDKKSIYTTLLIIEDMSFYIKEVNKEDIIKPKEKKYNKGKPVKAECAIMAGKNITVVLCDNGKLIDMSDIERDITSLRSYIVTMYISRKLHHVMNLMTMGNNRCSFEVPVVSGERGS